MLTICCCILLQQKGVNVLEQTFFMTAEIKEVVTRGSVTGDSLEDLVYSLLVNLHKHHDLSSVRQWVIQDISDKQGGKGGLVSGCPRFLVVPGVPESDIKKINGVITSLVNT